MPPRWSLALALAIAPVMASSAPVARAADAPAPAAPAPVPAIVPPVLLQSVAPNYPAAALAAGTQADVTVRITIDDAGLVTGAVVVTPVGDGFDEAAIIAAQQYLFEPATIGGVPSAVTIETVLHFVLEAAPATPVVPPPTPDASPAPFDDPAHVGTPGSELNLAVRVVRRGTRAKVAGAFVTLRELGLDAITDDDGHAFFHGLAPGHYQLVVVKEGFDSLERPVEVTAGERTEVKAWVAPQGGNPYATVVEGARDAVEVTRYTLQHDQLTSVPGTFGDPIRVIQSLPGVARAPFGLGVLLVRGSNPDDTGVYIDGHEVPLLFHFLGGPSILNAEMVDSIDLYPGGFPVNYGRHHGGVVAIGTRSPASDGLHGSADVDVLDASAYVRAPIGKRGAFAVAGRRSYLDAFLGLVLPAPAPGQQRTVVPVYYDWQARADYRTRAAGTFSAFAIGSGDSLDVLSSDPADESSLALDSSIRFYRLIASWKQPLAEHWQLAISPAVGRDTVRYAGAQAEASGAYTSLTLAENVLSVQVNVVGRPRRTLRLETGLDFSGRWTHYQALVPIDDDIRSGAGIDIPPEQLQREIQGLGLAAYGTVAWDVGRWRLLPGLRVDGYRLESSTLATVDPRLAVRYRATDDDRWIIKGYLGRFHQPPQPEAFDAQFGNPDVHAETGTHVGVGAEWKPMPAWFISGEAYFIDRADLVAFTRDVIVNDDDTVDRINFDNHGHGRAYGAELLVKREITEGAYGWLSYTFSRAKQVDLDGDWVATLFDQTHTLNAVASYKVGRGWELGARFQLSTGRPFTPAIGGTFDADAGGYAQVTADRRSARISTFDKLDVRAEKTWLFKTWSLGAYLDIQNVYGADNVEAVAYDYRFRTSAPVTGIPLLPTLGVKGQW